MISNNINDQPSSLMHVIRLVVFLIVAVLSLQAVLVLESVLDGLHPLKLDLQYVEPGQIVDHLQNIILGLAVGLLVEELVLPIDHALDQEVRAEESQALHVELQPEIEDLVAVFLVDQVADLLLADQFQSLDAQVVRHLVQLHPAVQAHVKGNDHLLQQQVVESYLEHHQIVGVQVQPGLFFALSECATEQAAEEWA